MNVKIEYSELWNLNYRDPVFITINGICYKYILCGKFGWKPFLYCQHENSGIIFKKIKYWH